jgi:hypothetical protein
MKYWYKAVLVLSFTLLFASVLVMAGTIMAPYIGLGSKENFLLYSLANITRRQSGMIGFWGMILGIFGVISGVVGSQKYSWVQNARLLYLPIGRVNAWLRARVQAFLIYFALPPKAPRYTFRHNDQYFLLFCSIIGVTIYLFKPIYFECDAAMYYNYAKFLAFADGGVFADTQPPGYPAFLVLTGQILFDTFYGTIIVHAIMGTLMPLLVYRTLAPISRPVALAVGCVFILSTIPFYSIAVMLAPQLLTFLTILTFYFYSRYYFSRDPRFIPLTIIVALLAMLTRWEGMFALITTIFFIALIARTKTQHRRLFALSLVPVFLILVSWTGARAIMYRDPGLLFSLHSGSGQQLFWTMYHQLGAETEYFEKLFGVDTNSKQIENALSFGEHGIQVVVPENGPETTRLAKVLVEYVRDNPDSYRNLKEGLDTAYRPAPQANRDFYYEAFGRFEGDPEKLVRNIFATPNMFYPPYIFSALVSKLGISEADQLLKSVAWEGFSRHKLVALPGLKKVFSFYGVEAAPVMEAIATKTAPNTSPIFVHWKKNHDSEVEPTVFDIAGCLSRNLPDRLFSELKAAEYRRAGYSARRLIAGRKDNDDVRTPPAVAASALETGHLLRNLVRNIAGPVFLLGVWILVFSRHRLLYFPMVITVFALSGAYGMLGVGAGTRYEFPIQPLILFIVGGLVQHAWEWYRTLKSPK